MIEVSVRKTTRERLPEWVAAITLTFWGVIMVSAPLPIIATQYLSLLLSIAPEDYWGMAASVLGLGRLGALGINGLWRPTAHLRAIGAFTGIVFWAVILISYISLPWASPALSLVTALLLNDFAALWYAAGDAKTVDEAAAKRVKNGSRAT